MEKYNQEPEILNVKKEIDLTISIMVDVFSSILQITELEAYVLLNKCLDSMDVLDAIENHSQYLIDNGDFTINTTK
jgi:hypothetical protein